MIFISIVSLWTSLMSMEQVINGNRLTEGPSRVYYINDEKLPYTGKAIYSTEEGKKYQEGYFKDGRESGPWKYFYRNGETVAEGNYEYGVKSGKWYQYSRDGKKVTTAYYTNGFKQAEHGLRPDGIEFDGFFQNGIPWKGVFKEKHPWGLEVCIDTRGNMDAEKYVSYRYGLKEGLTTWFGPDKKILAEGYYLNDERWKGKFVIQRSQFLWEIVSYSEGVPDGEICYYTIRNPGWRVGDYYKHEMIELKPCGVYKEGQRWQGLFIKPCPNKENIWERMFYEEGKLIKKEYTKAYSGSMDPVKDDELLGNRPSSRTDSNPAK